jgi:hypothetical protein
MKQFRVWFADIAKGGDNYRSATLDQALRKADQHSFSAIKALTADKLEHRHIDDVCV